MKKPYTTSSYLAKLLAAVFLFLSYTAYGQVIMFDDFNYSNVDDPQLSSFNKWGIVDGVSGPPEGGVYSKNNITFINDPANSNNRLMTLSTTVNGSTRAVTHSRIETAGYEYFEGTYAARVYFSDVPFTYKDGNVQTFYTIVSSSLAGDGSRYSEIDFEYLAADKWGISPDNKVLYLTSWNRYQTQPEWAAWKAYITSLKSWAGWHTCVVSCTDGVNVKFYMDGVFMGSLSKTDNDGTSVYPRSNMNVSFANWIWNNVIGGSTANRTTTMQVDWTLYYKNQELSPADVNSLVSNYRSQGLQRRNLAGQQHFGQSTCNATAITPYLTINGGAWQQTSSATLTVGSNITIGPHPTSGGSWSWTGPNGFTSTSREITINNIQISQGGNYIATYTNSCGAQSTATISLTVNGNSGTNVSTFYRDCNYAGTATGLPVGDYTLSQLNARGIYNNDISSIRVNSGYRVTLYDGDNFSGASLVVSSDNSCLVNNSWNDRVTSLRVAPTSTGSFSTTIEAENYALMSGIQTESCSEGGLNVGWFDTGDWMTYNVNIPSAGTYKVTYRVASIYSGRSIRLEAAGGSPEYGTITLQNSTGNWQAWTAISHNVTLPAGQQQIALTTYTGGININNFTITNNLGARIAPEEAPLTDSKGLLLYPNPVTNILNLPTFTDQVSTVEILDLSGVRLIKQILQKGEKQLDLSELAPGGYLIKISSKGVVRTEKFYKH